MTTRCNYLRMRPLIRPALVMVLSVTIVSLFLVQDVDSFVPEVKNWSLLGCRSTHRPSLCASSAHSNDDRDVMEEEEKSGVEGRTTSRRTALARVLSSPLVAAAAASGSSTAFAVSRPVPAVAADDAPSKKQTNLSEKEILEIVVDRDLVANQFLVNGRLTRSVYDESCTFRDEIDTYGLEQWMKGTARLFDGDRSKVVLVPGSVETSSGLIRFRFVEYLCFNVPVLKPIVYLSGTLFLERSETTGLITSYREKWDQDVKKVLTSESKLFTSNLSTESLDNDLDAFFEANANR